MKRIVKIEIRKINKERKIPLTSLNLVKIIKLASGINSKTDIPIIITNERLKQKVINLLMFSLCHLKKITKVPNTVDNPASDDKRNGIKKDIVSPNKVYVLNQILRIFLFNF